MWRMMMQGTIFSESEVARAVCDVFESMESGDGLTMDEFVLRAADMTNTDDEEDGELICQLERHRHGLCEECYDLFVKIAGEGLVQHSAEPPASHFRKLRREQELATMSESPFDVEDCDAINAYLKNEREKQYNTMIWEYVGEWRSGVIHGKGYLIWANGNRYDVGWEDGMPIFNGSFR